MEQGNEGDGIVLFQYRQIECDIPDTVLTIGQITPDQLINIGKNNILTLIITTNKYIIIMNNYQIILIPNNYNNI